MINTIYVEQAVHNHDRTGEILARFPDANVIPCHRYTEIFNRKAQNFRLQKKQPALILAEKSGRKVLPTPDNYALGAARNYYFSHMLNCIYDCRYCFLQGMFQSAHFVLFVNYEDFADEIIATIKQQPDTPAQFFSGYDCDSLALEPVTQFCRYYLPLFRQHPEAGLELRTKSTQIRALLETEPLDNVVVAFSFTPDMIARHLEHKTPPVEKRIEAMMKLHQHGWRLGLRFDPLIYNRDYRDQYRELIESIFHRIDGDNLHSVSLGSFRLPKDYFHKLAKLYPEERLFAGPLAEHQGLVGYQQTIEQEMLDFCAGVLRQFIPEEIFFPCHETVT